MGLFDITRGPSNSAQVPDLVGLYLLFQIGGAFPAIIAGFYRDYILLAVCGHSKTELNWLKKSLRSFLKDFFNLNIIYDINYRAVMFLDVTLNLDTSLYYPFRKLNKSIQYINVLSNHPKSTIKSIVISISIRVSTLSANKEIFQ